MSDDKLDVGTQLGQYIVGEPIAEGGMAQVYHANCLMPGGFVAATASKLFQTRSIVLCYGYDVCDMNGLVAILGRWSLRQVDTVLCATRYCANIVQRHVPKLESRVFLAGCDETSSSTRSCISSSPARSVSYPSVTNRSCRT